MGIELLAMASPLTWWESGAGLGGMEALLQLETGVPVLRLPAHVDWGVAAAAL